MTVHLGPIELANPWILAPMAGVSEWPYRIIALRHGAAAAPTELV
ncbi:MAG: tRNA dihydrouridine synthase DusB, partial [Myxococcota bacterium]